MNCVNSLSQSFPYESLSLLVNNHFTQVALDLVRALVPSHIVYQHHDSVYHCPRRDYRQFPAKRHCRTKNFNQYPCTQIFHLPFHHQTNEINQIHHDQQ